MILIYAILQVASVSQTMRKQATCHINVRVTDLTKMKLNIPSGTLIVVNENMILLAHKDQTCIGIVFMFIVILPNFRSDAIRIWESLFSFHT